MTIKNVINKLKNVFSKKLIVNNNGVLHTDNDNTLSFHGSEKEYLRIDNNGHITWNIYTPFKRTIKIKNRKMLTIALIGLFNQMTGGHYDMTLLDKDLYDQYLKFIESKK